MANGARADQARADRGNARRWAIPGVAFNFSQPIRDSVEESTSGARGQVVLKLFGPDIPSCAAFFSRPWLVKDIDGVVDLDLYRDAPAPQVHVQFDRQALARQGIAMETAQKTLEVALAGNVATTLWEGEFPVPVRVRLPYVDRMDEAHSQHRHTAARWWFGPPGIVGTVSMKIGNSSIFREGNARYMALKFNVEGRDIGSVVKDTLATFKQNVKLPEGYQAVWGGEWENQQRAASA
jgi:cobalt-zinc-cadmium resistance protein CzcA